MWLLILNSCTTSVPMPNSDPMLEECSRRSIYIAVVAEDGFWFVSVVLLPGGIWRDRQQQMT